MSKSIDNFYFANQSLITALMITSILLAAFIILLPKLGKKRCLEAVKKGKLKNFIYDDIYDIFYTPVDTWQRIFGYNKLYDDSAKYFGMILDSEPVYFKYDGKYWLIQFWKGQYGITSGAEVGIYYHKPCFSFFKKENPEINPEELQYKSIKNKNLVPMSIQLMKGKKTLYKLSKTHWWLGGFKIGEFSYPHELSAIATLHFHDLGMCNAFLDALLEKGLGKFVYVDGNSVTFEFVKPSKQKGQRFYSKHEQSVLTANRKLCDELNKYVLKNPDFYLKIGEVVDASLDQIIAFTTSIELALESPFQEE